MKPLATVPVLLLAISIFLLTTGPSTSAPASSSSSGNCECGIENISPRVIRGHEAKENRYPWMVMLKMVMYDGRDVKGGLCAGSIINDRWILTAGHCIDPDLKYVGVHIGEHCNSGRHVDLEKALKVESFHRHPQYSGDPGNFHDIGLVQLSRPLSFNSSFSPVCLPDFENHDNLLAAGWGKSEVMGVRGWEKAETKCLREAELAVLPPYACKHSHPYLNTKLAMCAGGRTGVCEGDSGGPLMTRKEGNVYQVGIVSFGRHDCGIYTQTPAIFEKVNAHIQWIRQKTLGAKWCQAKHARRF